MYARGGPLAQAGDQAHRPVAAREVPSKPPGRTRGDLVAGGAGGAVRKVVFRTDANDVPDVVGDCGQPMQNAELLTLIDSVAAKAADCEGRVPGAGGRGSKVRCGGYARSWRLRTLLRPP